MNKYVERLYNGIIKENPTFVLMLGMCPTLAVTSSAINGLGMGLSTTIVLVCSNLLISLFRKVIPNGVRMPAYIVIVASLVTVVDFLMKAFVPSLSSSLGVYIPLIVVNCIILGRAESYASKNGPVESIFDGLGMGFGFTIGLTIIGLIREVLGSGKAFNIEIFTYYILNAFGKSLIEKPKSTYKALKAFAKSDLGKMNTWMKRINSIWNMQNLLYIPTALI